MMFKWLLFVIFMVPSLLCASQWQGKSYSENSNPQKIWFERSLSSLALKGHEDILDIGCGDGKLTLELAKKLTTGSVVGLDKSSSMVDHAKKHHKKKNLSFLSNDACTYSLPKKFDVIVSFTALHWVKDLDAVIKNAKKHLKPSGRLYFVFPTKFQHSPMQTAFHTLYQTDKWGKYFSNYHPGYYSHELDSTITSLLKNGLSLNELSLQPKLNVFDSEGSLFSWLKAWIPQQTQVPNKERNNFIKDYVKEYKKHNMGDKDTILWRGYLLKIDATLMLEKTT